MESNEHEEAEKRGQLHADLSDLVTKYGLDEVVWMLGVIRDDRAEAEASEPGVRKT